MAKIIIHVAVLKYGEEEQLKKVVIKGLGKRTAKALADYFGVREMQKDPTIRLDFQAIKHLSPEIQEQYRKYEEEKDSADLVPPVIPSYKKKKGKKEKDLVGAGAGEVDKKEFMKP